jgi:hypothetical protein
MAIGLSRALLPLLSRETLPTSDFFFSGVPATGLVAGVEVKAPFHALKRTMLIPKML